MEEALVDLATFNLPWFQRLLWTLFLRPLAKKYPSEFGFPPKAEQHFPLLDT